MKEKELLLKTFVYRVSGLKGQQNSTNYCSFDLIIGQRP